MDKASQPARGIRRWLVDIATARALRKPDPSVFDQYESRGPSGQNAVDAVPGWSTALPPEIGVVAGAMATFVDIRIGWAADRFGPLEGMKVLELGPLEAGHTIYLERLGASVTAIEANKRAYLRCLITKELVGLTRAKFLLGDFVKGLETDETRYDLIVASGVLYHMRDPLHLLHLAAKRSNALFLWTHYVTEEALPIGDTRRGMFVKQPQIVTFNEIPIRLYRRTYARAQDHVFFNGGMADDHSWMHRDDMLAVLGSLGYGEIHIGLDEPQHPMGPAFCVFARKTPVA